MSLFVKLDVNYVNNPKVIKAGLAGTGLHTKALCLAKATETDGWLDRSLLYREGADDALIDALIELRLFEADGDRVRPWDWHDRNPSQAAIDATRTAKADAARAGNHKRWKHPGTLVDCLICNAEPQVARISDRSLSGSDPDRSPDTETEADTEAESDAQLLPSQSEIAILHPQPVDDPIYGCVAMLSEQGSVVPVASQDAHQAVTA
jgi:hypothetical protein